MRRERKFFFFLFFLLKRKKKKKSSRIRDSLLVVDVFFCFGSLLSLFLFLSRTLSLLFLFCSHLLTFAVRDLACTV